MGMGPHGDVPDEARRTRWTDNVARVYEVIRRRPEVSVEWPRLTGRSDFRASWPLDPGEEDSQIRSIQHHDLGHLASALEKEFPE